MQQVVVLTGVEEKKRGSYKHGPWALRVFEAAGGTKFQTFDVNLGDALVEMIAQKQSIELEYEVEANGGFSNNVVRSFKPAASSKVSVPAESAPPVNNDRELRIMRQSGLDRAIATVAAGIVEVGGISELFELSDVYITYFENGV